MYFEFKISATFLAKKNEKKLESRFDNDRVEIIVFSIELRMFWQRCTLFIDIFYHFSLVISSRFQSLEAVSLGW